MKICAPRTLENKVISNKNEKKKYHTVGTIPQSNIKIVERGKSDTPNVRGRTCLPSADA